MIARLKLWIAGFGLAVMGLAAIWFGGRKAARTDIKARADRDYREARKEIDNADLGLGASDDERIERLRDFAAGRASRRDP